jgi:hypothetical protein
VADGEETGKVVWPRAFGVDSLPNLVGVESSPSVRSLAGVLVWEPALRLLALAILGASGEERAVLRVCCRRVRNAVAIVASPFSSRGCGMPHEREIGRFEW